MAALLVAAALVAPPPGGYARGERATIAAGGNFRSAIAVHAPAPQSGGLGAGNPAANSAVARALAALGLDAPAAPAAMGALDNTPAGSQLQVNTYTTDRQQRPSVAVDADGDFVVVWQSYGSGDTDSDRESIQAQRYNAAGSPLGSQFQVNTYTTSDQQYASVAMDADGDFVVVWQSFGASGTDTDGFSIQGQRYDAAGNPQGGEFQVNTYTTNHQRFPEVAMDADGDFVVAWMSNGSGGTDSAFYSIQGQRFDAAGTPQGSQFQVNTYTTDNQFFPRVALDADGDFVVVWQSLGSDATDSSDESIQGQRYTAAGSAVGSQFQVNTYTTSFQRLPAVGMDADGDFVVVWYSYGSFGTDTDAYSIQGQRYTAAGSAAGSEFQVNTYTTNSQFGPSVALDADGDFAVVWQSSGSSGTDSDGYSIQGQSFTAAGVPQGSEFQVNTYTTNQQRNMSVALDADGDFVVVWQSEGSGDTDTSDNSIQAQRFRSSNPATPTGTPQPPTAVDLRHFRAIGLPDDRAILVWESVSEIDTLGFDVLRKASTDGEDRWVRVNASLIPAEGSAGVGRTYTLRDAPGPGAWRYRLEDVGAGGKRSVLSVIDVRVGPEATGGEVFVPIAGRDRQ